VPHVQVTLHALMVGGISLCAAFYYSGMHSSVRQAWTSAYARHGAFACTPKCV